MTPTTDDRDRYEEAYRRNVDTQRSRLINTILNCGGIVVFAIIIIALYILGGR